MDNIKKAFPLLWPVVYPFLQAVQYFGEPAGQDTKDE